MPRLDDDPRARRATAVVLAVLAGIVCPAGASADMAAWLPREVVVRGGRITLDHPGLGGPQDLVLQRARLIISGPRGDELTVRGQVAAQPVTLTAFLRMPSGRAQPFDIDVDVAGISGHATGTRHGDGRLELTLDARGDAAAIGRLAPGFPAIGPIEVQARVQDDGLQVLADELRIAAAGGVTTGTIAFSRGATPRLKGSLQATRVVLPGDSSSRGPSPPAGAGGSPFSNEPLPLPPLGVLDIELDLGAGELRIGEGIVIGDAKATILAAGQRARLGAVAFTFAGARYEGTAALDGTGPQPAISLNLGSENVDLGALVASWGAANLFDARGRLRLELAATGASSRALASSLAGRLGAYFINGRISAEAAGGPVVGVQRFLGLTGATRRAEWVAMPCLVMRLNADAGVVRPDPLLIDTALATGVGTGRVDLREERWALTLTPYPKGFDLSLGIPVRVTGPLANPRVGLDEAGLAASVGRLVGTALLFPPALLADAFLGVGDSDPCGQILKRGVQNVTPRQSPGQGLVDGVTRGVRGLFGR